MASLDDIVTNINKLVQNIGHLVQVAQNKFPAWQPAPPTATSAGVAGQVAYDTGFIYVCVGPNQWKRAALTTF